MISNARYPNSSDRYSRQPPKIAPSRFVPNANGASEVAAKRLAKMTFAAKIGSTAIATATTTRTATLSPSSQLTGTTQPRASPASSTPYITVAGGVGIRAVNSTAARTAVSTPAKTKELTSQVVPNNSANPVTALVYN